MKKLLMASALAVTLASHAGVQQEVKFKRGESSTQISGGVIRGERDQYVIGAGKDQYLAVTLTSAESNAVLDIYGPGYKVNADGDVDGTRLRGASETTRYVGQLPVKGQYLIVVGGTRGNADYKLSVGVTAEAPVNLDAQKATPAAALQHANPPPPKPPTLAGSWICNEAEEDRPTVFFEDGTFMTYSAQDLGNHVFASGLYQLQGNRLEIVQAIGLVIRQSDGVVSLPWGQSTPGGTLGMTNFRVQTYQINSLEANKLLRTRLQVTTGPGGEIRNRRVETNCVRSVRHPVLEKKRQEVPESLYMSLNRVMGR